MFNHYLLDKVLVNAGLSLIFQVDGELSKVAGGQKKSGATEWGRGGFKCLRKYKKKLFLYYTFNHFYS